MRGKRRCGKARTLEMEEITESGNERESDKGGLEYTAVEQKIKHSGKMRRKTSSRTGEKPDRQAQTPQGQE